MGFIARPTIGKALAPLIELIPGVTENGSIAIATTAALLLATAISMIFGELVPKNLAITHPNTVIYRLATPFRLVNALFKPVILSLNAIANATVRALGIEPREELEAVRSLEELEILIAASAKEGTLPAEEFSLLRRSITFGGKTAADALHPRVVMDALPATAQLEDVRDLAVTSGHSRFPVYGDDLDNILGVVHVRDMFTIPIERRWTTPVTEIVHEAPVFPESRNLEAILLDMRKERQHMAIIVDEYGGTAGIITIEDLLEEIVGDIEDEHDERVTQAHLTVPLAGTHVLSGLLHPDEVQEISGLELPEGDYETLAGFMLTLFDRIPSTGDHVSFEDWELKVIEMDRNRISQVLVVGPSAEKPEDAA